MNPMASIVDCLGGAAFLRHTLSNEVATGTVGEELTSRICSWADIAEAVVSRRLQWPQLRVFRAGVRIPEERYTTPEVTRRNVAYPRLDFDALQKHLATGATLSIGSIEEMLPGVRTAAQTLSRLVHETVEANAYASWGSESAFGPHWDHHDVVVVQVSGRKHWTVFGRNGRLPLPRDADLGRPCPDGVVWEGTLDAGDVLYVPRGWWHDVAARDGGSLHLTFFFSRRTLVDYALFLVEQLRSDDRMRMDVARFDDALRAEQTATVREILADRVNRVPMEAFLAADDAAAPVFAGLSLPWRVGWTGDGVPERVVLLLRSPRLAVDGDRVTLVGGGRSLTLTAGTHALVRALITGPASSYHELRERTGLGDEALLAAVRSLLDAGVIAAS